MAILFLLASESYASPWIIFFTYVRCIKLIEELNGYQSVATGFFGTLDLNNDNCDHMCTLLSEICLHIHFLMNTDLRN